MRFIPNKKYGNFKKFLNVQIKLFSDIKVKKNKKTMVSIGYELCVWCKLYVY